MIRESKVSSVIRVAMTRFKGSYECSRPVFHKYFGSSSIEASEQTARNDSVTRGLTGPHVLSITGSPSNSATATKEAATVAGEKKTNPKLNSSDASICRLISAPMV